MLNLARVSALFLILITGFRVSGQDTADVARLKQIVSVYGQAEVTIKYPGFEIASDLSRQFSVDLYSEVTLHIILNQTTIDRFLALGIPFIIVPPPDTKGIKKAENAAKAMNWQSYPTYTQYDSIMRKLATDFPSLCRLDTIGSSINGKQVLRLKYPTMYLLTNRRNRRFSTLQPYMEMNCLGLFLC